MESFVWAYEEGKFKPIFEIRPSKAKEGDFPFPESSEVIPCNDKIKKVIAAIIGDQLGMNERELLKDTSKDLKEFELDSLDAVEIAMGIEDHYAIELTDSEAESLTTIDQISTIVERKLSTNQ